jgi:hypothetical protein
MSLPGDQNHVSRFRRMDGRGDGPLAIRLDGEVGMAGGAAT